MKIGTCTLFSTLITLFNHADSSPRPSNPNEDNKLQDENTYHPKSKLIVKKDISGHAGALEGHVPLYARSNLGAYRPLYPPAARPQQRKIGLNYNFYFHLL
ncbi:uncharacterized protein LOC117169974 [Belonocnema kinseyi]|uniref:uncharacterized protein LOC117169974 n=1 Tax=Belonocnema kinseyi TaxID=2817044 RepID=UPI00143D7535|nr:uncharacterized protein LOC117169974 [Belonocnema kinseyi]